MNFIIHTVSHEEIRLATNATNRLHGLVDITSSSLREFGTINPNGPISMRMGSYVSTIPCALCNKFNMICFGHYGLIDKMPLYLFPLTVRLFARLLHLTCLGCGALVVAYIKIKDHVEAIRNSSGIKAFILFNEMIMGCNVPAVLTCDQCGAALRKFKVHAENLATLYALDRPPRFLSPEELAHIKNSLLASKWGEYLAGFFPMFLDIILRSNLLMTPTAMRPPTTNPITRAAKANGNTMRYLKIISATGKYLSTQGDYVKNYQSAVHYCFTESKEISPYPSENVGTETVLGNIGGREGFIRTTLTSTMGARAGRGTTYCHNNMPMACVEISIDLARMFASPVPVCAYNLEYLGRMLARFPYKFPKIITAHGTIYVDPESKAGAAMEGRPYQRHQKIRLAVGDIVFKMLESHNFVVVSRPPILQETSTCGVNIMVRNTTGKQDAGVGFHDNFMAKCLIGDFDGDHGFFWPPQTGGGIIDAERTLSFLHNHRQAHTGNNFIGFSNNVQLGAMMLTQIDAKFEGSVLPRFLLKDWFRPGTKAALCTLLKQGKKYYNIYEIISVVLPPDLNYITRSKFALDLLLPQDKCVVVIEKGVVSQGLFDVSIVENATTSLWEAIGARHGFAMSLQICSELKYILLMLQNEEMGSVDMNFVTFERPILRRYESLAQSKMEKLGIEFALKYNLAAPKDIKGIDYRIVQIMTELDWINRAPEVMAANNANKSNPNNTIVLGLQGKPTDLYAQIGHGSLPLVEGKSLEEWLPFRTMPFFAANSFNPISFGYQNTHPSAGCDLGESIAMSNSIVRMLSIKTFSVGNVVTNRRAAMYLFNPIVTNVVRQLVAGAPYTNYQLIAPAASFTNTVLTLGQLYNFIPHLNCDDKECRRRLTCGGILFEPGYKIVTEFALIAKHMFASLCGIAGANAEPLTCVRIPFIPEQYAASYQTTPSTKAIKENMIRYAKLVRCLMTWPLDVPLEQTPPYIKHTNSFFVLALLMGFPLATVLEQSPKDCDALCIDMMRRFVSCQLEGGACIGMSATTSQYHSLTQKVLDAPKNQSGTTNDTKHYHDIICCNNLFQKCNVLVYGTPNAQFMKSPNSLVHRRLVDAIVAHVVHPTHKLPNGQVASVEHTVFLTCRFSQSILQTWGYNMRHVIQSLAREEEILIINCEAQGLADFLVVLLVKVPPLAPEEIYAQSHKLLRLLLGHIGLGSGIKGISNVVVDQQPSYWINEENMIESIKIPLLIIETANLHPILQIPDLDFDSIVFENFHTHIYYFGIISTAIVAPWTTSRIFSNQEFAPHYVFAMGLLHRGMFLPLKSYSIDKMWPDTFWARLGLSHPTQTIQRTPLMTCRIKTDDSISQHLIGQTPATGPCFYNIILCKK